jgi:hypothetical protein
LRLRVKVAAMLRSVLGNKGIDIKQLQIRIEIK